jgi:hypothetical protein
MVLRKFLEAIKVEENSSQVLGHFKTKERLKKAGPFLRIRRLGSVSEKRSVIK